jgi:glycosyltransferase involved in cell wall biosynthesis
MRILHVSDTYGPTLGGIELHVRDLATRQRADDEATVVTLTPDRWGTETGVVRLPRFGLLPRPAALQELRRMIGSGRYDVVHAHSSMVSPLAWAAAAAGARVGVPTVMTLHSMLPDGLAARAVRSALPAVPDAISFTAVSSAAAASLRRVLPRHEVTVLPNGIDPADWTAEPRRPSGHVLTLVSTMRTTPRKRPLQLLRVLRAVRESTPEDVPLRAVIAGEGPLDAAIRRELSTSDLGRWVTLAGRLERPAIRQLLGQADLYLAPARLESFGIAALEARSAGLPVIGMAGSGLGDFVRDGQDGFLVASDEEMAARAAHLLSTPLELRRIQRHNREHPPHTSWARVLELHRDAYTAAGAHASARSLEPHPDRIAEPPGTDARSVQGPA